jgi:hypothetical protein
MPDIDLRNNRNILDHVGWSPPHYPVSPTSQKFFHISITNSSGKVLVNQSYGLELGYFKNRVFSFYKQVSKNDLLGLQVQVEIFVQGPDINYKRGFHPPFMPVVMQIHNIYLQVQDD